MDLYNAVRLTIWCIAFLSIAAALFTAFYLALILKENYLMKQAERHALQAKALIVKTTPAGHQVHVISHKGIQSLASSNPNYTTIDHLPPLLPILTKAERIIIAGGSGSGKTTLAKHLIKARANEGKVIIIDPHSPSKIAGIDVIGAGRNYEAIGEALSSLIELMDYRYSNFGKEFDRASVFIDEWTSIRENVSEAGQQLQALLTESRKVNIHLCILTHSMTNKALGIDDQIKESAIRVSLSNDKGRVAYINKKEYSLPGPFKDYPKAKLIENLPDGQTLKARRLHAQGFSNTAIAREIFGVERPSGKHIKEIQDYLEKR